MQIREPNGGESRWNDDDRQKIVVKHGLTTLDLTIGNHEIALPGEATWTEYTYGEFRRKHGNQWAKAWLFRTNDIHDPERLDMLRARVGGVSEWDPYYGLSEVWKNLFENDGVLPDEDS